MVVATSMLGWLVGELYGFGAGLDVLIVMDDRMGVGVKVVPSSAASKVEETARALL